MYKYYVRLAARLGPVPKKQAQTVPPFNAYKLYATTALLDGTDRPDGQQDLASLPRLSSCMACWPTRTDRNWTCKRSLRW